MDHYYIKLAISSLSDAEKNIVDACKYLAEAGYNKQYIDQVLIRVGRPVKNRITILLSELTKDY